MIDNFNSTDNSLPVFCLRRSTRVPRQQIVGVSATDIAKAMAERLATIQRPEANNSSARAACLAAVAGWPLSRKRRPPIG